MNLNLELDNLLKNLPEINADRNYWLVRTQSGQFYDTFLKNNFISVGYNKIPSEAINDLSYAIPDRKIFIEKFKGLVTKFYPEENRPGAIASQVTKFIFDIKKDDIVIIPSVNSTEISIGRVTGEKIILAGEEEMKATECDNKFRRKIEWQKTIRRTQLDPYLYKVLFAHKAINKLNHYADYIERTINNFYIKKEDINLVLYVNQQQDLLAKDIFSLGFYLLQTLDDVATHFNLDVSSDDIDLKINLNSEGKMQFIGKHLKSGGTKAAKVAKSVIVLGIISVFINGGGFDSGDTHIHTDGLIKNITDYLNSAHDRKTQEELVKKYMDSLQVKTPDDLVKLMKQTATNKDKSK